MFNEQNPDIKLGTFSLQSPTPTKLARPVFFSPVLVYAGDCNHNLGFFINNIIFLNM